MKVLAFVLLCALGLYGFIAMGGSSDESTFLIIGGDTRGYLSPCGCTKPMSGGILRKARVVRALVQSENGYFIENGGLVKGPLRQDELKAETLAEILGTLRVTAVNVGASDAQLGRANLERVNKLTNGALVSTQLENSELTSPWREAGNLLIGGASVANVGSLLSEPASDAKAAAERLVKEAAAKNLVPVLMFQGDREQASALAEQVPGLRLIVFRSQGTPAAAPSRVGNTYLVSPGDQTRYVLSLNLGAKSLNRYQIHDLGPEVEEDEKASESFQLYLSRVKNERLLEQMPRGNAEGFVGSKACFPCHATAAHVWENSAHAMALKTLEDINHDRDPDCVGCHVVGLPAADGFRDRKLTPDLTDVGCESCHGPGAKHVFDPLEHPMPKVGENSCISCHNTQHSPKFDFASYWMKIKH
ncbi:MAG: multiheme c-type cytochrome [Fimbriimonadaceae bacterium]